ncbi:MAG: hypothetical protein AB7S92_05940 [Parvibaculaceae bacterium]|jgi:hypothetical protein
MWIRRSLWLLATCAAQTVCAQAQDYEVVIRNEGVSGYVEVKCPDCTPDNVLDSTLMAPGDKADAVVHGTPPKALVWSHKRQDDGQERTGSDSYGENQTVRVLSAN